MVQKKVFRFRYFFVKFRQIFFKFKHDLKNSEERKGHNAQDVLIVIGPDYPGTTCFRNGVSNGEIKLPLQTPVWNGSSTYCGALDLSGHYKMSHIENMHMHIHILILLSKSNKLLKYWF